MPAYGVRPHLAAFSGGHPYASTSRMVEARKKACKNLQFVQTRSQTVEKNGTIHVRDWGLQTTKGVFPRITLIAALGVGQAFCSCLMAADATTDAAELQAVKQAALEATKIFYPRAEKRKSVYGFAEADNLAVAVLGEPARLYFLDDKDVRAYQNGQALQAILKPAGQWFVPVAMGGTNRAMLGVVDAGDGKWIGSTFGMAPLARTWQNIQAAWPGTQEFTPQLVICPPAEGYFFTVPQIQPANLTPLANIPPTWSAGGQTAKPVLVPAMESMSALQKILEAHGRP